MLHLLRREKMNIKNTRRFILIVGIAVVALAVLSFADRPGAPSGADQVLNLKIPPFANVARAETASAISVIAEEAGIAAWFQASGSINLDDARSAFRTIETETADYIIGSVPLTDYPESQDIHVYVHIDGWILAYYLAADPVGKIFDWRAYHDGGRTNITTKLENAVAVVAYTAGTPFSSATHYDFRYPNATHLMLIVEWVYYGTDSCEVNLPGEFDYYERSWSLGAYGGWGRYRLDGAEIKYAGGDWPTFEGTLTVSQLLPDQFHSIGVEGGSSVYGGLALVYGVP